MRFVLFIDTLKRDVKVTAKRSKFITFCCLIKAKFGLEFAIPKTKLIYVAAEGSNLIGILYIAQHICYSDLFNTVSSACVLYLRFHTTWALCGHEPIPVHFDLESNLPRQSKQTQDAQTNKRMYKTC